MKDKQGPIALAVARLLIKEYPEAIREVACLMAPFSFLRSFWRSAQASFLESHSFKVL